MSEPSRKSAAARRDPPFDPTRLSAYEAIIDVRSPAEFAEDHVPGAINLPVLDDAERARVGALYVQHSKFEARKIGAALVAANIARHLQGPLADKPGAFAPLIYCWRGGMRSGAMRLVFEQIGWRAETLPRGYKGFRTQVIADLHEAPPPSGLVLLDGDTGVGKTEILGLLAARGVQTLDLEGLAAHRGSLFGAAPSAAQPGQKLFESRLWAALTRLDPSRPIMVEAESSKIGARVIPPAVWKAMRAAPRMVVRAPLAARARYLTRAYADLCADGAALSARIATLTPMHGHDRIAAWRALAVGRAFEQLAAELMAAHYDPRYARARRKHPVRVVHEIALAELAPRDLAQAADAIAARLATRKLLSA